MDVTWGLYKPGQQRKAYESCAALKDSTWLSWLELLRGGTGITVRMVNGDVVHAWRIESYSLESMTVSDGPFLVELKRADVANMMVAEWPLD